MSSQLYIVIISALIFEFINGMRDSSNIVATMISSRAFSPRMALGMTAIAEFFGPFLFGITVAKTIGSDIVDSNLITLDVLLACLCGSIVWNMITWFFGIPSSSSHALIGGLIGATMVSVGWQSIKLEGLEKVLIALFTSPVIGFVIGFIVLRVIYFLSQNATPNINNFFRRGQFFTVIGLAFSHGTNDAQKTMGIITLSLIISGTQQEFTVPFWVILVSAGTMALGTSVGGWRLIRTLGGKFYKIRPVHSIATQLTSAVVILGGGWRMISLPPGSLPYRPAHYFRRVFTG
ncbi:inorganic phosphate transporter [Candidatus Villigracilis vicinus]|uniref:inorganic phosphate transporter n=1 Tax=Candidatus Villigracilis vicinus TaxID=3140679 RepID=UPI0031E7824A